MSDREIQMLKELVVGLCEAQVLIVQHLIKAKVVNRQDITNAFDFMATEFKRLGPTSQLSSPIQFIRDRLDQDLPDFPPVPTSPKSK